MPWNFHRIFTLANCKHANNKTCYESRLLTFIKSNKHDILKTKAARSVQWITELYKDYTILCTIYVKIWAETIVLHPIFFSPFSPHFNMKQVKTPLFSSKMKFAHCISVSNQSQICWMLHKLQPLKSAWKTKWTLIMVTRFISFFFLNYFHV